MYSVLFVYISHIYVFCFFYTIRVCNKIFVRIFFFIYSLYFHTLTHIQFLAPRVVNNTLVSCLLEFFKLFFQLQHSSGMFFHGVIHFILTIARLLDNSLIVI